MTENLRRSFSRFLSFLGFEMTPAGEVVEASNFAERVPDVWQYPNHNWLRITRVLRSLTVLGLEQEAGSLFRRLDAVYSSRRFPVTAETFRYWEGVVAAQGERPWTWSGMARSSAPICGRIVVGPPSFHASDAALLSDDPLRPDDL